MKKTLTPAEISNLWESYVTNTMGVWVSRHFIANTQDQGVNSMLKYTEEIAFKEAEQSKKFLLEASQALPQPFDVNDVNINAKPLFSDNYVILLKYGLAQAALTVYSLSLNTSTHEDIRAFYKMCLENSAELLNQCVNLMVNKGLHHPEIHIPTPDKIEKVDTKLFLSGLLSDTRPLNALEIGQIVYNYNATEIHKEFIRGSAQVTNSKELKDHYLRGVDIFDKQLEVLQKVLSKNGLPKLPTWETEVFDTTDSPFSERVMLYKHAALTSQAAARYGASLSGTTRKDIGGHFMRLMWQTIKYGEDTANLMIKYKFLDQLPLAKGRN
ncbi:DUF3231 family protein [Bacillus sp. Marseille-P3661]|uniref:DUF3231 family protein n=1 Tax=Bacillus sp. Marseille-P3661 TaxID=1936234 RepID=UPI0015E18717|nr:DUF3231 family protein [Bacillus sp. Marseille-P3661]